MLTSNYKRITNISILIIVLMFNNIFAKNNPYEGEVNEPSSEIKNNISSGIIYDHSGIEFKTPLNPEPKEKDYEKKQNVDNFIISLDTLEDRIKYFSPTYLNIKNSALSMLWMSFYARGGDINILSDVKSYYSDYKNAALEAKEDVKKYKNELNSLDKTSPDYGVKAAILANQIRESTIREKTNEAYYDAYLSNTTKQFAALGYRSTLDKIININDNSQIKNARDQIMKSLTSAVLTYMQLYDYVAILNRQKALYNNLYDLKKKNYELGIATTIEVEDALNTYESSKTTYNQMNTTLVNVKQQIAINLGYDINDIDKLVFIEPEPNLDYINNINIDNDRDRAYHSNKLYNSITRFAKDNKLPGSTGDEIFY